MSFATDYTDTERPGSLTPRGVFIPPWYKPHTDLSLPVKSHDGERELGFTIGDVAVERRWAIDSEGCVMEPQEFRQALEQWYLGQWAWQNPPQQPLPIDTSAFPHPETYVAKGPDPAEPKRLVPIFPPVVRQKQGPPGERPVSADALQRAGWKPAPKKE